MTEPTDLAKELQKKYDRDIGSYVDLVHDMREESTNRIDQLETALRDARNQLATRHGYWVCDHNPVTSVGKTVWRDDTTEAVARIDAVLASVA